MILTLQFSELKISDMDEWIDSDDDSSASEGGDKEKEDSDSGTKKKPKKGEIFSFIYRIALFYPLKNSLFNSQIMLTLNGKI